MKISKKEINLEEDVGILYVAEFRIEDKDLVKIGVTTRSIEDRIAEILVSIFKKYREFPYCRPKRFRKTGNVYEKEAQLHNHFKINNYEFKNKFSGSSEFFDVPLETVVIAYEQLLDSGSICESRQEQSNNSE